MKFEELSIDGVYAIRLDPIEDERGSFARTYSLDEFENAGIHSQYLEHSIAINTSAGTLRGMHYSVDPIGEHKLVRCDRGAVKDVIVDLREHSATYGRVVAVELNASSLLHLYVPPGCAHGYQTLEDDTVMGYMISCRYVSDFARGISYKSAIFKSIWPLEVTVVSARDLALPKLDL